MSTLRRDSRPLRVIIAEDEFFIAVDIAEQLQSIGARIVAMRSSLTEMQAIDAAEQIDAAVLDINLQGELVYPLVDSLIQRDVPVVFVTGYSAEAIPARYANIERCEKPIGAPELAKAIGRAIAKQRPQTPDAIEQVAR